MLKWHERILVFLCASVILGILVFAVMYVTPTCIARVQGACVVEVFTASFPRMPIHPDISRTQP